MFLLGEALIPAIEQHEWSRSRGAWGSSTFFVQRLVVKQKATLSRSGPAGASTEAAPRRKRAAQRQFGKKEVGFLPNKAKKCFVFNRHVTVKVGVPLEDAGTLASR